jgi:hypothetical protein
MPIGPYHPCHIYLPTFPSFMDYKLHSGSAALGPSCGLYYELDRAGLDSRKFPARLYVLGPFPFLRLLTQPLRSLNSRKFAPNRKFPSMLYKP